MPEIRQDAIHGHWTVFSPDRARRPAQLRTTAAEERWDNPFASGQEASTPTETYALREPGSKADGPGWRVRVVPNRYPAVFGAELSTECQGGPHVWRAGVGHHEVVIETPDPGADLEDRTPEEVVEWLEVLRQRLGALAQDPRIEFIQIFKNRGIMAGATLAHPHSQIVALPMIPPSNLGQLERQREGYRKTGVSVWDAVVAEELAAGVRVVRAEAAAVAFCPFAARVPYETCIVPNEKSPHFLHASEQTVRGVGFVLHEVLTSLARVAARPDYNILLHTAPVREERWRKEWDGLENWSRWWIEVVPRVGRFAGFELGTGMFINSLWPEEAARQLREQALPDNTKCAL